MPYKNPEDAKANKRRYWAAKSEEEKQASYQYYRERRAANKEKFREYTRERYHKRRNKVIEQLGGKCVCCGITENLEFDHIDRTTKKAKVSTLLASSSLAAAIEEAKKCQLLCNSCHIQKTINNAENRPITN